MTVAGTRQHHSSPKLVGISRALRLVVRNAPTSSASQHVLIVEDDDANREVMRLVLELAGHRVSTAGTGKEALERAERDKPDTVLLDLGLPDQNGRQVSAALRARPHAPRIVITSGTSFNASDAAALGADEILRKPFEPESLLAALSPKAH